MSIRFSSNSKTINDKLSTPLTAFGELRVESKTPQVQIKFPYGQQTELVQELTNNASSTVTYANGNAIVTCAGAAKAFSQIRSVDTIRYGPGQGSQFLGTCIFTTGVANSSQVFGPGDDDEGYFFGYNGTSFGVLRRSGGSLEIKQITITGAATGTGNITITLDGAAVTVAVTAGDPISEVVRKILAQASSFFNAGRGWEVHTPDNVTVQFTSLVAEDAAGAFSFVDTDTTGVTASAFSEPVAGVAPSEFWVAQASWNIDPMDGTGPSGMTLDPTRGNVYQVEWQYLGYGAIVYSVENQTTGRMQDVHRINYANTNTVPTLKNPTLHCNLIAKTETGYSGGTLVMKTSSMAGFIQGIENPSGVRRSIGVEKSMSTTENVLLILTNGFIYNSQRNKITVYPDFVAYGSESAKTTTIRVYRDVTGITGGVALTDIETGVSVMKYGSTGTTFTGGRRLLTMIFNGGGERAIGPLGIKIRPGERLVITGQVSSGANSLVDVSVTWVERI